jgi:hypothetical protein
MKIFYQQNANTLIWLVFGILRSLPSAVGSRKAPVETATVFASKKQELYLVKQVYYCQNLIPSRYFIFFANGLLKTKFIICT